MFSNIAKIKNFGVFGDFSPTETLQGFAQRNVLYGWNYSGKSTFSRIFQSIELGELPVGWEGGEFELALSDGSKYTHNDLGNRNLPVRVFNSDFVSKNLSFDGRPFGAILLLGEESIEAQDQINKKEQFTERLEKLIVKKKGDVERIELELSDARTKKAADTKNALQIIEAYTAARLRGLVEQISIDPSHYLIDDDDLLQEQLGKATLSDSNRLGRIDRLSLSLDFDQIVSSVNDFLAMKPSTATSIQRLVDNGDIAKWVREGLVLHQKKENCEFCLSPIASPRLEELQAHFSRDYEKFEARAQLLEDQLVNLNVQLHEPDRRDFYAELQDGFDEAWEGLQTSIDRVNKFVQSLSQIVEEKKSRPFDEFQAVVINPEIIKVAKESLDSYNSIVDSNNEATDTFDQQKQDAIQALKLHFCAEYFLENDVPRKEKKEEAITRNILRRKELILSLQEEMASLKAQISQAQKGREKLNSYISKFLTNSSIEIRVVEDEGQERFVLMRAEQIAKNLSEGEQTAVAFSFFLTKLVEVENFQDLIVFIDDPVSSLDSNLLFQANAVLREVFYEQSSANPTEWFQKNRQLFLSTHNFEFFGLLRELPNRGGQHVHYYQVVRTTLISSEVRNLPKSILRYSSEYHYLWEVIHDLHEADNILEQEGLLGFPNVIRRFVELYTYSKIPSDKHQSVDVRAEMLFGTERAKRLLKVLHYFSHSNNIQGLAQNRDLVCDIEQVVSELVEHVRLDELHYNALMESLN